MRHRTAPVVRFVNVSGGAVRDRHGDTGDPIYASKDALLELRPESEKLTDRQQERQREVADRLGQDARFHRLPDRETGTGEDETPKRESPPGTPATIAQRQVARAEEYGGQLARLRRERIVLSGSGR